MCYLAQNTFLQGGKYRIERVLGQGGFGITYSAYDCFSKRKVAIKEFFFREFCQRDDNSKVVSVPTISKKELVSKFER